MKTKTVDSHIDLLQMHNVGLHRLFTLDLTDMSVVEISGEGETGKTTILDAAASLITGKDLPPIRHGEDEAWIAGTVAGISIKREMKDGKTVRLSVLDETGQKVTKSPQDYLGNTFPGIDILLRPIDLYTLYRGEAKDRKKATALILKALDIDPKAATDALDKIIYDDHILPKEKRAERSRRWVINHSADVFQTIDEAHATFYEMRKDANKDAADVKKRLDTYTANLASVKEDDLVPPQPPDVGDLYKQQASMRANNQERDRLDALIADLEQKLDAAKHDRRALGGHEDTAEVDGKIQNVKRLQEQYNERVAAVNQLQLIAKQRDAAQEEHAAKDARAQKLDAIVKRLAQLPRELLAQANLPIEGMEVRGDQILLPSPDNPEVLEPLEDRGDSRILCFCCEIAMALAPEKFKVLLLDGAERLGVTKRLALVQQAQDRGFQVLMTRVTDDPQLTVEVTPNDTATVSDDDDDMRELLDKADGQDDVSLEVVPVAGASNNFYDDL